MRGDMTRFRSYRPLFGAFFLLLWALVACAPLPRDPGWPGLLYVPAGEETEASFIVVYTDTVRRVNARTGEAVLLPAAMRSALDDDDFAWRVESCAKQRQRVPLRQQLEKRILRGAGAF